jgi:hypothetical protein
MINVDSHEWLIPWIQEHADYIASDKCLWILRFYANDISDVLLPDASRYDPPQVSFLNARLKSMANDAKLLEEGMRHLPKRLVEACQTNGHLTESEQIDLDRVRNLIDRLRDYGVIACNEIDQTFNDEIYGEFTYEERQRQAATERGIKALVRFGREMIKQQKGG